MIAAGGVLSKGRALLLPLLDCKDYTGIFKLQGVEGESSASILHPKRVEAPSFSAKRSTLNQSGSFILSSLLFTIHLEHLKCYQP